MTKKQGFFNLLNGKIKFKHSFYNPTCDSLWLASSIRGKIKSVLDVGAGTGAVSLALLTHDNSLDITCLEILEENLRECEYNFSLNKKKANLIKGDIFKYRPNKTFDLVITNPPYFKGTPSRHNMHHNADLKKWVKQCAMRVKPRGYLNIIISPEYLTDVIQNLKNFGDIYIIPLFSSANIAERVIISARLNIKSGTKIYSGFNINEKLILMDGLTIFECLDKVKPNV